MRILWWGSQAPISLIHQFLLAPVKDDIWYKYIIYDILFLPPPTKDDIFTWYLMNASYMYIQQEVQNSKNVMAIYVWSVCRRIGNKTEWDVRRWFYPDICSPVRAPYWPHPFPLHTGHPIEIPTRGSSPHNILLPGIIGSDLEHLSSVTSFAVWNHCLLCKLWVTSFTLLRRDNWGESTQSALDKFQTIRW